MEQNVEDCSRHITLLGQLGRETRQEIGSKAGNDLDLVRYAGECQEVLRFVYLRRKAPIAKLPIAKLRRSRGYSCSLARMEDHLRTVAHNRKHD
jgi:hypothetical protein